MKTTAQTTTAIMIVVAELFELELDEFDYIMSTIVQFAEL